MATKVRSELIREISGRRPVRGGRGFGEGVIRHQLQHLDLGGSDRGVQQGGDLLPIAAARSHVEAVALDWEVGR